jgi:hypothetical protein
MLNAALGYTTEVMAVMLDAALGLLSRRRRLAWVQVAPACRWPARARPGGSGRDWVGSAVGRGLSRPWGPTAPCAPARHPGIARRSAPLQLVLLVVVRLVTYVVVEIPVLSSALRPQTTAARVTAFAAWLDANKIRAAAALASVIGVALIIKGLIFS